MVYLRKDHVIRCFNQLIEEKILIMYLNNSGFFPHFHIMLQTLVVASISSS